jgi:hypothetical protein
MGFATTIPREGTYPPEPKDVPSYASADAGPSNGAVTNHTLPQTREESVNKYRCAARAAARGVSDQCHY